MRRIALLAAVVSFSAGCSAATWQGVAAGLQAAAEGYNTGNAPQAAGTKLMLFGGANHRTYLGCLSCSKYDAESVFNAYGSYGSKYATESILNRYSDFGSPYSSYSACNRYASDPPVIVDGSGNFYGRLTISSTHPQRTQSESLRAWIASVCAE